MSHTKKRYRSEEISPSIEFCFHYVSFYEFHKTLASRHWLFKMFNKMCKIFSSDSTGYHLISLSICLPNVRCQIWQFCGFKLWYSAELCNLSDELVLQLYLGKLPHWLWKAPGFLVLRMNPQMTSTISSTVMLDIAFTLIEKRRTFRVWSTLQPWSEMNWS